MSVTAVLEKNKMAFGNVICLDRNLPFTILDLTAGNRTLKDVDLSDPKAFERFILAKIAETSSAFAIGKYDEDRTIYDHSDVFCGENRRTIHLGIDLWVSAGNDVFAPLDGKVHSFNDNAADGDYGPTIILQHELDGTTFFTLYGHLSRESLNGLSKGQSISKNQVIGHIGNYPENGNWPPHLHFQIIVAMLGKEGDFPGVTSEQDREKMLALCPDPNLILCLSL